MKKLNLKRCTQGTFLSLLLLCSCATEKSIRSGLPADVALNRDIARTGKLIVMLRLEGGEELPFYVDTGSPTTIFDKSLEPKLGQRLADATISNFGAKENGGLYNAPRLYLGDTLLMMTDNGVVTWDCKATSIHIGRPIMGILGMDVLENYCIQLDFAAGKMRFLDPHQLNRAKLGNAFPISFSTAGQGLKDLVRPYVHNVSLIGGEGADQLIDTGYPGDAAVKSFRQEIAEHRLREGDVVHGHNGRIWISKCGWNNETYTNLLVGEGASLMGLRFLARHLVTLDFPDRMMYLKQAMVGSWTDENTNEAEAFLNKLKKNNQLPGWSKNDEGVIYCQAFPGFDEFDGWKNSDSSNYHYYVARTSGNNSWKLQKAWRTDQHDNTIEEFPVP